MQIKQRLRMNTAISAVAMLCICLTLVFSFFRIHTAIKAQQLADDLIQTLFERTSLESDFLKTGSERAQEQWLSRHKRIGTHLQSASSVFTETEERTNVSEMIRDHAASEKLFLAIMEHQKKTAVVPDAAAMSREVTNRFQNQLIMRSYDTVRHARELQQASNRLLSSALTLAGWWIAGIIAAATAIATLNAMTLERTITRRMDTLHDGALVIGNGNLDHRIDAAGSDELTTLSRALNDMAVKLRQSYRVLEDEIMQRKQIEESLQHSREDLQRAQEVAHVGSWRLNVRKNELLWSEENWRIFGLPSGTQLTYEIFLSTVHPDDRSYVDHQWQAALRGEPYDIDHRIVVGETVKWVRERATLEFDDQGILLGGFGTTQDITERKQAELAARRLAQFPEENPNPVMRISADGSLLYANTPALAWLKSAGVPEERRAAEMFESILAGAAEENNVVRREVSVSDGQTMLISAIRPQGETYVNLYGLDISERKAYEKALLDSKERLRLALDTARMGTWDWNILNNEAVWNDEHFLMLGYAVGEITPSYQAWAVRVHPDDLDAAEAALRHAMYTNGDYHAVFRVLWPDGSRHWIEAIGRFERNAAGEAVRNYGVMVDITARKAADEILRQSHDELELKVQERTASLAESNRNLATEIQERFAVEEQLRSSLEAIHDLYENAPCGYHSLDGNGVFVRINDTELRWLGYHREELIGAMKISDLMTPESREQFDRSFPLLKAQGAISDLEIELVRKDGSVLPVVVSATAVRDHDGNFVMTRSSVFDITHRRQAEREALRAAHLASIGELAAGVAHEINNPVNAIINYAQILVNKGDKERKEYAFAGEIVKEGERIAAIVNSLLSFSRKSSEVKLPTGVQELLDSTLPLIYAQLEKSGIILKISLPALLPDVVVVPQQIQQVFLNIISNARYALNRKYPEPNPDKILEIRGEATVINGSPMIKITFLDHGTGIPPAVLQKALEPFYTTKPGKEGTGLGLSICNNIVMKHGGAFNLASIEGQRTEVSVSLPSVRKDGA